MRRIENVCFCSVGYGKSEQYVADLRGSCNRSCFSMHRADIWVRDMEAVRSDNSS
jgi:hypothetical protein